MTDEELNRFENLSIMLESARDFKYDGDFDLLAYNLTKSYNNLSTPDQKLLTELGETVNTILKAYEKGQRVKKNPKAFENFTKTILEKKADVEAKYVEKLLLEQGVEKVEKYLNEKSDRDLDICMEAILADYRLNRTDENRDKWNQVLGIFNKKIVKVTKTKISLDERKLVRGLFEGGFLIPSAEDNKKKIGCSERFKKYLAGGYEAKIYAPDEYPFGQSHIDKVLSMAKDTDKLRKKLHQTVLKHGVPPKVYKDFNLSDAGMLFLLEYGDEKTVKKLKSGKLNYITPLPFKKINLDCSQGHKKIFKDSIKADEQLSAMIERYKNQGEDVFIHHKYYIFDAGNLKNMLEINDSGNLMMVVGENNHRNILHGVDYSTGEFCERLVDTKDGVDGKNLILFAGWRYNVYSDDNSAKNRETYLSKAITFNQGR